MNTSEYIKQLISKVEDNASVSISGTPAVTLSGSSNAVNATCSGTVAVSTLPAITGAVTLSGSSNSVTVSNFPATQPVSGTLNSNITSIGGFTVTRDVGVVAPGCLRVCLASDDVNTAQIKVNTNIIVNTIDQANNRQNVALNNVQFNTGIVTTTTIRTCSADDDPNLANIKTNIQTLSNSVTASKLQCEITNAPSVTVSNFPGTQPISGSITVSSIPAITGAVTLSGSSNAVNVGTINGQSVAFNVGTNGATVLRTTIATDDAIMKLLYEPRYQSAESGTFCTMLLGGYNSLIPDTTSVVIPNDATCTYTEANVVPPLGSSTYLLTDVGTDNNGLDGANAIAYVYTLTNTSGAANSGSFSNSSNNQSLGSNVIYYMRSVVVFATLNSPSNISDMKIANTAGTKFVKWIPPGKGRNVDWYIQVPGINTSKVYLGKLKCISDNALYGFRVYVKLKVFDNYAGTQNSNWGDVTIFSAYIPPLQNLEFDLSYNAINSVYYANLMNFTAYQYIIGLYVKGGSDAVPHNSSGSAYLSCKSTGV